MTKQNDPHRHHVVPIHYLKAFALLSESSHIWEYSKGQAFESTMDRGKSNPRKRAIKSACMRDNFYSFPNEDGSINSAFFEKELQKLEDKFLPSLKALRLVKSQYEFRLFLKKYKEDFVNYIILMNLRGFKRRQMVEDFFNDPSNSTLLAETSEKSRKVALHRTMFDSSPEIQDILLKGLWIYFKAPQGKYFLTSDSPVFTDLVTSRSPESKSLNSIRSVIFPISPKTALLITDGAYHHSSRIEDAVETATEETWSDINNATVRSAIEYLYHFEKEAWVSEFK